MYWGKCYVKVPKSLIVCTVANKHQFDMIISRLAVEKLGVRHLKWEKLRPPSFLEQHQVQQHANMLKRKC